MSEDNPTDFFNNQLRFSEDRFSFFSNDFRELTQSLSGISRSNGLEFGLVKFQWAIQPLVGRNENADGFFDYTDGFAPDIQLEEDLANLGVFGDENEPLLARALQEITGVSAKFDFTVKMPFISVTNSKMFTPMKDNMYLDTPSFITRFK